MCKAVSGTAGKIQKEGEERVRPKWKGAGGREAQPNRGVSRDLSLGSPSPEALGEEAQQVHLFTLSSLEEESGLQHFCSLLEAKR